MRYTLYYNNKTVSDIFNIINYLSYQKYNLIPTKIENNMSLEPMILTEFNKLYIGEKNCIQFYTKESCILHLRDKSNDFKIIL